MPLLTYLPARARTRSPRLRALGVGVCLLAGAALIAVPACAAGNSSEQNGVHLVSGHAANAAIGAAVMRPDPNYVDG